MVVVVSGRTPPPDFYHFRPAAIRNDIFTSTYSPVPDPLATTPGIVRLFDCVGTGCDELVRRVVVVGGDEETAAEAGVGFADRAA